MTDDETLPPRLIAKYPPADITPAEFEAFVAELLGAGAPGLDDYRVTLQDPVSGVDGTYVFDATVRFRLNGMEFLVVVEAKQHKNPIKRELVQVLHAKAQSVGASKAVLVATAPPQRGAITVAKTHGIALVHVTEGRYLFETRAAGPDPVLSREEAKNLYGIPIFAGICFAEGDTPGSIHLTTVDTEGPELIKEALLRVTD